MAACETIPDHSLVSSVAMALAAGLAATAGRCLRLSSRRHMSLTIRETSTETGVVMSCSSARS